jgi:hypothetical protein
MTPAEHAREVNAVRASLLLAPTRSERHGVYPNRTLPVLPGPHTFAMPVVHELPCHERRPL